ncbi:MAG TPA: LCP family protein [Pilimelia sp.]|nr:LCP family protein [Pilimelia sp.]
MQAQTRRPATSDPARPRASTYHSGAAATTRRDPAADGRRGGAVYGRRGGAGAPADPVPAAPAGRGAAPGGRRGAGGSGRPAGGGPSGRRRTRRGLQGPLWARLLLIFGAVLMLTSGGLIIGSKALIGRYTSGVVQQDLLGAAQKKSTGRALTGPINLLLLGVDERASNPGNVRSDTIIILHVPASHDQAYLVSVPRDTFVEVPPFPRSGYGGGHAKITDAFFAGAQNGAGRAGGAQLVALVLNRLTGIEFNGAAIIDFGGFRRVIDALGGVRMCVDHRVESIHMRIVNGKPMYLAEARKHGGGVPVVHEKGCRRMAGWEALDFSRQRYGLPKGDYDRQRHQQQLVKAMAKEATSKGVVTDLGKLDRVIKAAGSAFVLDTGGVPIADFIFTLKGVAANDLVLIRTNGGDFHSAQVAGTSAETLSPESLEMFGAMRSGTLGSWLLSHPDFVAKEK